MKLQTTKKIFTFIIAILMFFCLLGLYSCQKEIQNPGSIAENPDTVNKSVSTAANANVNVYVSGTENNKSIYWKNGSPVSLTTSGFPGMNRTNGIAVSGNDVYVGGSLFARAFTNGAVHRRAMYWKNNSIVFLDNGGSTTQTTVSGVDVYFSGLENGPVYWKNGSVVSLAHNSIYNYTSSIAVSGTNVYVAGHEDKGSFSIAKYWKNGTSVNLSNGSTNASASSIAISGTDVYVAGYEGSVAKYWKNGKSVNLTNGSTNAVASSIAVSGADVYVAGTVNGYATYWKNGVAVTLSNLASSTSSIAVSGTDVYVAGAVNGYATYWKNGITVTLSNLASSTNSIFITTQ